MDWDTAEAIHMIKSMKREKAARAGQSQRKGCGGGCAVVILATLGSVGASAYLVAYALAQVF